MHKLFRSWVVAVSVIVVIACLGASKAKADIPLPWISSPLSIQKQPDTASAPPTMGSYGNIDCSMENTVICSVPTDYGAASWDSTVRLSASNSFLPVTTYVDNRQHFLPVPNSNEAISYFSGPPYGLDLAFNYNLSSSITKVGNTFKINRSPDGKLSDKNNHLLAADIAAVSFSQNGQWMLVSDPNVAMLRVNLQTFEVVPFSGGLNYTIGLDPAVKTAVSNDGRYAVIASKNFNVFRIYDLSTCLAVPDTINAAVNCQSRDLGSFMQQSVPGYSYISEARFTDDNTLAVYAVYKSGAVNKTARYTISDSSIINQLEYLALGDSYISGEGAFDYMGGTDTDANKCHLSFLAYPFLIGKALNYNSYHSVACSGAATDDIINTSSYYISQADSKNRTTRAVWDKTGQTETALNSFLPGYIDQLDFVSRYQPKAITISIGGNDMGFAPILKTCATPSISNNTCYSTYEDRLELVRLINTAVFKNLVTTYNKLKAAGPPDMRIYAIAYPQIAKPGGDCALNVHLNADEVLFSQELINYLDNVVQAAAAKTGIYYVDTQDALYGHRLCEAEPGSIAMNGFTVGNDRPKKLNGPIGDESYHPNPMGYQLLENKIPSATHSLTNPMPAADLSAGPPLEIGQDILNILHSGRTINTIEYDNNISDDIAYQQTPFDISIDGARHGLAPSANLNAELHSVIVNLGSFHTDLNGNLDAQITIPQTAPAGYHTLHFYGTDISGQPIDIYKPVYVAAAADDMDGNGIPDSTQKCVGVDASGQDFDKDGTDDACDANITQPPAAPPTIDLTLGPTTPATTPSSTAGSVSNVPADTEARTGSDQVLAAETAASPLVSGIDDSQILISAANSSARQPSVLGAETGKNSAAGSGPFDNGINGGKYIFPGIMTMLMGALGLIFKRALF